MQTQIPVRPDESPVVKKKRWPAVLGVIVVLFVLSAVVSDQDTTAPSTPVDAVQTDPVEDPIVISAADFVDAAYESGDLETFCSAYYVIGDYDLAYAAFSSEADWDPEPGMPTVEEVFDELVIRC